MRADLRCSNVHLNSTRNMDSVLTLGSLSVQNNTLFEASASAARAWSMPCRSSAARAETGSSPADDGAERPSDRRLISVSASSSGAALGSQAAATPTLSCPAGLHRD